MATKNEQQSQAYVLTTIATVIIFILSYILFVFKNIPIDIRLLIMVLIPLLSSGWGFYVLPNLLRRNQELEQFRGEVFRRLLEILNDPDMDVRLGLFNSMLTTVIIPENLPHEEKVLLLENNKVAFELLDKHLSPPERAWMVALKTAAEAPKPVVHVSAFRKRANKVLAILVQLLKSFKAPIGDEDELNEAETKKKPAKKRGKKPVVTTKSSKKTTRKTKK